MTTIAGVHASSGEISHASHQVQVSGSDLSELAEQLTAMVTRFKLSNQESGLGTATGSSAASSSERPFFEWNEKLSVGMTGVDDQQTDLRKQKNAHRRFVSQVGEFQRCFAKGDQSVMTEAMNNIRDWLINPIQKLAKKYGPYSR